MNTTESPQSSFEEASAPKLIIGAGRVIWCHSMAEPDLYYQAQHGIPSTLEEFRNQGEKVMTEQRWRIALLKVNTPGEWQAH